MYKKATRNSRIAECLLSRNFMSFLGQRKYVYRVGAPPPRKVQGQTPFSWRSRRQMLVGRGRGWGCRSSPSYSAWSRHPQTCVLCRQSPSWS